MPLRVIVGILCCVTLYLIPFGVALFRNKHNKLAIFALNLLLGWTFIGWVVALIWALTKRKMVSKLKETIRDKSRDNLTNTLVNLGVKAEMAERGMKQEKIGDEWYTRKQGIINIQDHPIKWINICKKDRSKDSPPQWKYIFIVPDERLVSGKDKIKIKTIRKKSFPVFGKVIDTIWNGNDSSGLTHNLSNDAEIKSLSKSIGDIHIESFSEPGAGWFLRASHNPRTWGNQIDWHKRITMETWEQMRKLSEYLLSTPRVL